MNGTASKQGGRQQGDVPLSTHGTKTTNSAISLAMYIQEHSRGLRDLPGEWNRWWFASRDYFVDSEANPTWWELKSRNPLRRGKWLPATRGRFFGEKSSIQVDMQFSISLLLPEVRAVLISMSIKVRWNHFEMVLDSFRYWYCTLNLEIPSNFNKIPSPLIKQPIKHAEQIVTRPVLEHYFGRERIRLPWLFLHRAFFLASYVIFLSISPPTRDENWRAFKEPKAMKSEQYNRCGTFAKTNHWPILRQVKTSGISPERASKRLLPPLEISWLCTYAPMATWRQKL